MKKHKFIILFVLIIMLYLTSMVVFADTNINVIINDNSLSYNEVTGLPFLDDNQNVMIPLKSTLESIGATVKLDTTSKMYFVNYYGNIIKIPVENKYLFMNDIKVTNETPLVIKNKIGYFPLKKIFTLLNYSVSYDSSTNTFWIDNYLVSIPHPVMLNKFSESNATGKYRGYRILHGHPDENIVTIYFKGTDSSYQVSTEIVNRPNMNEIIHWSYNNQSMKNTRLQLYSFFDNLSELNSLLNYEGEFSPTWLYQTFGQVYLDFFNESLYSNRATRYVDGYLNGALTADSINFEIVDKNWISESEFPNYNIVYENFPMQEPYFFLGQEGTTINIYTLNGYFDFTNGFSEFNNIRIIDINGTKYYYLPDIKKYIFPQRIGSHSADWLSEEMLLNTYNIKIQDPNESCTFMFSSNRLEFLYHNEKTNEDISLFTLNDINSLDFQGVLDIQGVKLIKENDKYCVNLKDFNRVIAPKLDELLVALEKKEKEMSEWISPNDLFTHYSIEIKKVYESSKKSGSFYDYHLVGNNHDIRLNSLIDDIKKISKETKKTYKGIKVLFKISPYDEVLVFFRTSDLINKGLISE